MRFLSELEKLNCEKPLKKKDLAKAINTSPSYITQLYRGDKLINLITLAKIQDAFNITFEINAKLNSEISTNKIELDQSKLLTTNKVYNTNDLLDQKVSDVN